MNLYYTGPQYLAGPIVEDTNKPSGVESPIRILFGKDAESQQTTEAVLERCYGITYVRTTQ